MSKRKRREEEEREAKRLRDAARAHLDEKGYAFDLAKSAGDIQKAKAKKDNTLELVAKRKQQLEQLKKNNIINQNGKGRQISMIPQMLSKPVVKKIVKKVGQNTTFGIPQQNTNTLPENWVLVQSHSDETEYYFWNVKTNSTSWKKPEGTGDMLKIDSNERDVNNNKSDEDEDIFSSYDEEMKKTYYWSCNTWKSEWEKPALKEYKVNREKGKEIEEVFEVDGNIYNINDFEKARQDAINNRQENHSQ
jgi:hypothetical protein